MPRRRKNKTMETGVSMKSLKKKFLDLKFKNPVTNIRVSEFMGRAQNAISGLVDVAQAINDMGATPSLRNYAAVGVVALSKLMENSGFNPFDDPNFQEPVLSWEFRDSLRRIFSQHPQTRFVDTGSSKYQLTDLSDDIMLVFQVGSDNTASMIWVVANDELHQDKRLELIGVEMWKLLGTRIEPLAPTSAFGDPMPAELCAWDPGAILRSEQSDAIVTRAKAFHAAGYKRAVLLYGQPGTGKSCMVRAIASELSATTVFLDQQSVSSMSIFMLSSIVRMLRPEVMIVDDFDRISEIGKLLGSIDMIRNTVKLFLVTVNNLDGLDPAIVRAGRFDDIIPVENVRTAIDVIPQVTDPVLLKELDTWPVAFVEELQRRIHALGMDALPQELEELRKRIETNKRPTDLPNTVRFQEAQTGRGRK